MIYYLFQYIRTVAVYPVTIGIIKLSKSPRGSSSVRVAIEAISTEFLKLPVILYVVKNTAVKQARLPT